MSKIIRGRRAKRRFNSTANKTRKANLSPRVRDGGIRA